jgi:hypothetical protein
LYSTTRKGALELLLVSDLCFQCSCFVMMNDTCIDKWKEDMWIRCIKCPQRDNIKLSPVCQMCPFSISKSSIFISISMYCCIIKLFIQNHLECQNYSNMHMKALTHKKVYFWKKSGSTLHFLNRWDLRGYFSNLQYSLFKRVSQDPL